MNGKYTLAEKLIKSHLVSGEMSVGNEIALRIDQTLTQDATGTMAYLEFESMEVPRVKTELSVAYVDHNTLQNGFMNADDHKYIRTCAAKYGLYFSRPGNGICHQVHLERFGAPGKTLIGSDSHTPTGGALGMLAFGAGGMDVAVAMAGGAYNIIMPEIFGVELKGRLSDGVSAKDVILEILRRLSVKGGVNRIIEYFGDGLESLSAPERGTIANMGAELGASTSVFPADGNTREFLTAQGREECYTPLTADEGAEYAQSITIDLSEIVPLAACPHSPDNVKTVAELEGMKISQVCIGSCTNSSYADMKKVAAVLKGKTVAEGVSLTVSPGSKQVLQMLARDGLLEDIIASGARILECACGPCIGMGQSPESAGISLRTFNRNFLGRSGTADAGIYLVSPETAAVSAVAGVLTDPRSAGISVSAALPDRFCINDNMIIPPLDVSAAEAVTVERGPNIKPFPKGSPVEEKLEAECILKVGDNITTDHIMPAGASILPYRSNIPYLSRFCFTVCDPGFPERAKEKGGGIIIGGDNYGQGSSREHAALVPLYLGVKAVIVKSFARIHKANLINAGIIPLRFENAADYGRIPLGEKLVIGGLREAVRSGGEVIAETQHGNVRLILELSERDRAILLAGGLPMYMKGADK